MIKKYSLLSLKPVWRMENADGQGPYRNPPVFNEMKALFSAEEIGSRSRPTPIQDEKLKDIFCRIVDKGLQKNWKFGFETEEDFTCWFSSEDVLEFLSGAGFEKKIYHVDPEFIYSGTHQCMFWRPAAMQYPQR